MHNKLLFSIIAIFASIQVFGQNPIPMQEARDLGAGETVTVQGIVTTGTELGTIKYLQDETAGLAAYSSSLSSLQRGDEIKITGTLKDYNNLLEIDPVASFEIISSGNPDPDPAVITPNQMSEDYESELIRVNGVNFTTNPGGTFAGNQSYDFTSNGQSSTIYVRSNHPLIGEVIPIGMVDVIGICSQFYENFQLLLRDKDDIVNTSTINIITPVTVGDIQTNSLSLSWETNVEGSTEAFYGPGYDDLDQHKTGTGGSTGHIVYIDQLSPAQVIYAQVFSVLDGDTAWSPVYAYSSMSNSSGGIKVYFTKNVDHSVSNGVDAIWLDKKAADTLQQYIHRAKLSIDISIYNFNISQVATALNLAYDRGVDIRIIYDGETANSALQLLDPGIPKLASPTFEEYGIMHNKIMVVDAESDNPDEPIVWTGSTNWTVNNMYDDQNNIIIFQDRALARAYTIEFNEMWGSDGMQPNSSLAKFGPYKTDNTPHEFIIGGERVELYFSPSDQTNSKIVKTIESTNYDMEAATMLITRSDIGYSIRDKKDEGKKTEVIVNSEGECSALVASTLAAALGYDFKESGESHTMHNKYLIVDESAINSDPLVLTGCHNWSNSAEVKNDENTVIVHSAVWANVYYQEFKARFDAGVSLDIDEYSLAEKGFAIYPNPAISEVNINYESVDNGQLELGIYDLAGRLVHQERLEIKSGNNTFSITNLNLMPGVYMVRLSNGNVFALHKLIVN
ncbi:MAG: hypothetical protein B6I19_05905 [Bacteroidetes bacterium 4572_114]|nr:MAG: hypothetical protein B6I19_05905 [Bacteroidetes bacterium 4572_114]